jgi:predicted regulator of Ras-like GTPase activity (Roadblock/LC7/MglB family)
METLTKGKRGFRYLKEILKIPGVRGVIVTDINGNAVFEETSIDIYPQDRREVIELLKNLKKDKKAIFYIFTEDKIILLAKNPLKFKGFLIIIASKKINLGLLRIYTDRFLEL